MSKPLGCEIPTNPDILGTMICQCPFHFYWCPWLCLNTERLYVWISYANIYRKWQWIRHSASPWVVILAETLHLGKVHIQSMGLFQLEQISQHSQQQVINWAPCISSTRVPSLQRSRAEYVWPSISYKSTPGKKDYVELLARGA